MLKWKPAVTTRLPETRFPAAALVGSTPWDQDAYLDFEHPPLYVTAA